MTMLELIEAYRDAHLMHLPLLAAQHMTEIEHRLTEAIEVGGSEVRYIFEGDS